MKFNRPNISFLRVACGSSVYDHSKSFLDTLAPIFINGILYSVVQYQPLLKKKQQNKAIY